nr:MAG TPA: hypothetical protein [Caudoviricetes sp.]
MVNFRSHPNILSDRVLSNKFLIIRSLTCRIEILQNLYIFLVVNLYIKLSDITIMFAL